MFCYQCEQTAKGEGCTKIGVCGKTPDTAALQDLLIYTLKGLAVAAVAARKAGIKNREMDRFTCKAVFSTLTNVDFDPDRFVPMIQQAAVYRDQLLAKVEADTRHPALTLKPAATREAQVAQGEGVGVKSNPDVNPDILSL